MPHYNHFVALCYVRVEVIHRIKFLQYYLKATTLETVSTLAHMARFIIADLTDAKSILQELQAIVPNNPSVLIQPLLLASQEEPGMFDFFRRFPWVLEPYRYHSLEEVLSTLDAQILAPVEARYEGGRSPD